MSITETESKNTTRMYAQKLSIYHPNSAGTGAALQLEPRINRKEADKYNCFFLGMALQKTPASRTGGKLVPASFDWEHKLTVKLDFNDICEMLAVLEGLSAKLGGAKNGLFHQNGNASTVISLQKGEKTGYFIGLSKKINDSTSAVRVSMSLNEAEAIGLRSIFQSGLFFITFYNHMFLPAA